MQDIIENTDEKHDEAERFSLHRKRASSAKKLNGKHSLKSDLPFF